MPYVKTRTTEQTALSRRTEDEASAVRRCELLVIFVILDGEVTASKIPERVKVV